MLDEHAPHVRISGIAAGLHALLTLPGDLTTERDTRTCQRCRIIPRGPEPLPLPTEGLRSSRVGSRLWRNTQPQLPGRIRSAAPHPAVETSRWPVEIGRLSTDQRRHPPTNQHHTGTICGITRTTLECRRRHPS
jgi:hypothetical protein